MARNYTVPQRFPLKRDTSEFRMWLYSYRITITEFAKALGIDRTYLHFLMKGTRKASKELLEKIDELTEGKIYSMEQILDDKR